MREFEIDHACNTLQAELNSASIYEKSKKYKFEYRIEAHLVNNSDGRKFISNNVSLSTTKVPNDIIYKSFKDKVKINNLSIKKLIILEIPINGSNT